MHWISTSRYYMCARAWYTCTFIQPTYIPYRKEGVFRTRWHRRSANRSRASTVLPPKQKNPPLKHRFDWTTFIKKPVFFQKITCLAKTTFILNTDPVCENVFLISTSDAVAPPFPIFHHLEKSPSQPFHLAYKFTVVPRWIHTAIPPSPRKCQVEKGKAVTWRYIYILGMYQWFLAFLPNLRKVESWKNSVRAPKPNYQYATENLPAWHVQWYFFYSKRLKKLLIKMACFHRIGSATKIGLLSFVSWVLSRGRYTATLLGISASLQWVIPPGLLPLRVWELTKLGST